MEVVIEFDFKQDIMITARAKWNDTFSSVLKNLKNKIKIDISELYFLSNDKKIDENDNIKDLMNETEKQNKKIKIVVEDNNIKNPNDVICPECKEKCKIKNYRIEIYDCQKGHRLKNIRFDKCIKPKIYDTSKIICDNCNNKIEYNKEFYTCYECNMNLCTPCLAKHSNNHSFIISNPKNYISNKHRDNFLKYCKECEFYICSLSLNEQKKLKALHNEENQKPHVTNKETQTNISMLSTNQQGFNEYLSSRQFKNNFEAKNDYFLQSEIPKKEEIKGKGEKKKNKNHKKISKVNEKKMRDKNQTVSEGNLKNIKSVYILKAIFDNLTSRRSLIIIKYNKNIQQRLNIDEKSYKDFCETEIEITPTKNVDGKFINILKKEDKPFFHIYFDDNNKEIKRNYLTKNEKVNKIKILIDYQVKSFFELFSECSCIESLYFEKCNRNDLDTFNSMFYRCTNLKEINLKNMKTGRIKDMSYLFSSCNSLQKIDLTNFITDRVEYMNDMFSSCLSLKEINLSNFNTENVNNIQNMFNDCSSLEKINLLNFRTDNIFDMSCAFNGCSSLKELDLSNFKTDKVGAMFSLFRKCSSLKQINISNFNTKNVIDMSSLFQGCSSLKELNLSHFFTDKVTDISYMFDGCSSLKKLNISNFNTSEVTNMSYMFNECSSLDELMIDNFKTYKVTNMSHMFNNCSSLKKMDLSNFTFENVDVSYLFSKCFLLDEVDFQNLNADELVNMNGMFSGCSYNLKKKIRKKNLNLRDEAFN